MLGMLEITAGMKMPPGWNVPGYGTYQNEK
jgi:hypothetical protein